MNPNTRRRIDGTREQQRAMALAALAAKLLLMKRTTSLNSEQRMQAIRFLATR